MSNQIHGQITKGISPDTTVLKTLQFVQSQLPRWRDDPDREAAIAEEKLNDQLCKHLNAAARVQFQMVYFHHEERQAGRRRVDLSALLAEPGIIEGRTYSIYDPILVLEGKRLPAPASDREREYVTGRKQASGGIQRFKLGLHGAKMSRAGIVGYIQKHSAQHWFSSINIWIDELVKDGGEWKENDRLGDWSFDVVGRVAICSSRHVRVDSDTDEIELTHLWVEMTDNGTQSRSRNVI